MLEISQHLETIHNYKRGVKKEILRDCNVMRIFQSYLVQDHMFKRSHQYDFHKYEGEPPQNETVFFGGKVFPKSFLVRLLYTILFNMTPVRVTSSDESNSKPDCHQVTLGNGSPTI